MSKLNKLLVPLTLITAVLTVAASKHPKPPTPTPAQLLIGRRTFFDFGPPFEHFEMFSVTSTASGVSVQRIQLDPPGLACGKPAEVRGARALISEKMEDLLGGANPCNIPDKEVNREQKRCKHCLSFSGAKVVLQVQCGEQTRRIRMDVLDRDLFDQRPNPPQHTSWTMTLLDRLEKPLGDTIMDRPAFGLSLKPQPPAPDASSFPLLSELAAGKLDALFGGRSRASEVYRLAQPPPPEPPTIELVSSTPYRPTASRMTEYAPLALQAGISGQVAVTITVDTDTHPSKPVFTAGHPVLRKFVASFIPAWTFPEEAIGKEVEIVLNYKAACLTK